MLNLQSGKSPQLRNHWLRNCASDDGVKARERALRYDPSDFLFSGGPLALARKAREMFDHVGIVVTDLERAADLYAHMLAPLGLRIVGKHGTGPGEGWVVISSGAPSSPFFVVGAGRPSFWQDQAMAGMSPVHLCFKAPSQDAVDRFHKAGLAHGATCNGPPGVRRPPFYCAFLIDLDGNNVEAGYHLHG